MARAFKVHSVERDAQTDDERLDSISAAVEATADGRMGSTPRLTGSGI